MTISTTGLPSSGEKPWYTKFMTWATTVVNAVNAKAVIGTIAGTAADAGEMATALAGKVATSRLVAGKPLSADVTIVKGDVGLGNVDNTSDAAKPVSTAQATALGLKADTTALASYVPTTRTIASKPLSANVTLAKADVGLSNVDNTSDANKPVSSAMLAALNGKVSSSTWDALERIDESDLPAANLAPLTTLYVVRLGV